MTYTTPFTATPLAIIQASGWNTSARDNIIHFRGLLPDPGASGKALVSTGATAAAWSASPTITDLTLLGALTVGANASVTGNIGVAGDVGLGGNLDVLDRVTSALKLDNSEKVQSIETPSGTVRDLLFLDNANIVRFGSGANSILVLIPNSATALQVRRTGVGDFTVWDSGNDGAGSGMDADTVDGVQESALAKLASANFTTLQRGGSDVLTLASLGYSASTYTGDGVTTNRVFNLGFLPKQVLITGGSSTANIEMIVIHSTSGCARSVNAGNVEFQGSCKLDASGFIVGAGANFGNVSGVSYAYTAFR